VDVDVDVLAVATLERDVERSAVINASVKHHYRDTDGIMLELLDLKNQQDLF